MRSCGFGIFRVYWVLKSKGIILSNLRAEGSWGKVLNLAIFVESAVQRKWNSWKQLEAVGSSRKQSGAARRDHVKIVNPPLFLTKKLSAQTPFFWKFRGKELETVGARTFDSAITTLFRTSFWRKWTFMKKMIFFDRGWRALCILPSTCALRHNGVNLFDVATSKSGPRKVCFDTFRFQTCFAPQRRARFRHVNLQKCSENDVFWHFLLQNVLCATLVCNFSPLIWPDVFAPAAAASLLFEPPEPQNIGKTQCFATSLFVHLLVLSKFPPLWSTPRLRFCRAVVLFHLSILSEV